MLLTLVSLLALYLQVVRGQVLVNGQIFTNGLAIIDSPAPSRCVVTRARFYIHIS